MSQDNHGGSIEMASGNPSQKNPANHIFSKRKKKGFSFTKYLSKKANQASGFVKSFDLYGQPITLNYQGEDTFKTCPGGFISMIILGIMLFYALLRG